MKLSIIIVNWNTREILRDCLASVYVEAIDGDFETIVIDNGSADGSQEMVRREFPQVILIANEDNRGFAAANNQGMAISRGRYVLLLNSDTIVLDHAIDRTIEFAELHPEAGVVGCRVLNRDLTLQQSCFMFPSLTNWFLHATYLSILFPANRFFGREQMSWWLRDDVREVDVVTGCFMLVRSEAIRKTGVMDERFFMYAEETDWCYRFRLDGWKCLFTPSASIIHLGGGSAPKLSPRRARMTNRSFTRYVFKHWSKPRAIAGMYLLAAFYALRLVVLAPQQVVSRRADRAEKIANHWAGLKDILQYRQHLIDVKP